MIHQPQKIRFGLKLTIYETLFARDFSFNTYKIKLQIAETIHPRVSSEIIVVNVKFIKLRPDPKTRSVSVNRSFPPIALLIHVFCFSA